MNTPHAIGVKVIAAVWMLLAALSLGARAATDFDPAAAPAQLATSFVKADRLQALAKVKRAAIAQFRVEFAVENEAKAQSSGTTGATSSRADVKLVGVTDEARQATADRLYDQFVQDLAAAGLEVVPLATLRANADYQSLGPVLRGGREPVGTRAGKSIFVGARGMPYYMTNDDRHLGLGTLLGGISTTQPQNIEPQIAKTLDAAVFRVTLAVAFADQTTRGGLFNTGSSVKTDARLVLVPNQCQWLIITPEGRAQVYLNETVFMGSDALQLVETTADSDKAVQAAANIITGLFAKTTRSAASYEARTTPAAYEAVVTRHGLALQAAMLSALRPGLTVTPMPAVDAPQAAVQPAAASAPAQ